MYEVVFTPHAMRQLEELSESLQMKVVDIVTEYMAISRLPGERFHIDPKMYSDVIGGLEIVYRKEKSRVTIALIKKIDE